MEALAVGKVTETVEQQVCIHGLFALQHVFDFCGSAIRPKPVVSVFFKREQKFGAVGTALPSQLGKDIIRFRHRIAVSSERFEVIDYVVHALFAHFPAAHRAVCAADAGEYQAQIVIDFSCSGYSGTRIPDIDLLFYGNCRRDVFDRVHVGLCHTPQELTRVGA